MKTKRQFDGSDFHRTDSSRNKTISCTLSKRGNRLSSIAHHSTRCKPLHPSAWHHPKERNSYICVTVSTGRDTNGSATGNSTSLSCTRVIWWTQSPCAATTYMLRRERVLWRRRNLCNLKSCCLPSRAWMPSQRLILKLSTPRVLAVSHLFLFQLNSHNMLNTCIYHQLPPTCFGVCLTTFIETTALLAQKLCAFCNVAIKCTIYTFFHLQSYYSV